MHRKNEMQNTVFIPFQERPRMSITWVRCLLLSSPWLSTAISLTMFFFIIFDFIIQLLTWINLKWSHKIIECACIPQGVLFCKMLRVNAYWHYSHYSSCSWYYGRHIYANVSQIIVKSTVYSTISNSYQRQNHQGPASSSSLCEESTGDRLFPQTKWASLVERLAMSCSNHTLSLWRCVDTKN